MKVINGGFLDLKFNMELMPETRLFKVQGMGHGQLRPERRSSRFEIGSARQIQFGKNWHARERDLEDLDVDLESWVSLFHRGWIGLFSFVVFYHFFLYILIFG